MYIVTVLVVALLPLACRLDRCGHRHPPTRPPSRPAVDGDDAYVVAGGGDQTVQADGRPLSVDLPRSDAWRVVLAQSHEEQPHCTRVVVVVVI